MIRSLGFGLILGVFLAGCGGGGGGSSAAGVVPTSGGGATTQATQAKITIVRPVAQSQARSAKFIPTSAQSIRVHVLTVNGATPDYNFFPDVIIVLSTLNPACTTLSDGGLSCSVTVKVPQSPGVVLQISAYNSTDGSGTPVAVVTTPPVDTTQPNPVFSASLGGVPAHLLTTASVLSGPADGSKHTLTFSVWATDSSNNIILPPGNYPTPITIGTSGDTTGAMTPVTTAVASPGPNAGQSAVSVTYDGSKTLAAGAAITLTSGSLSASVPVNAMILSPTSLNLFTPGQSTAIAVSEANYNGKFTLLGNGTNFTVTCIPASCIPSTVGGSVQFMLTAGTNGTGTFTIGDTLSGVASIPFTITGQVGGTINLSNYKVYEYTPQAPAGNRPYDITAGTDGKNVWFTDTSNAAIGAIDTSTCVTSPTPTCTIKVMTASAPTVYGIVAGKDGNMYVSTAPFMNSCCSGGFTQVMSSLSGCPATSCSMNTINTSNSASRPSEVARTADGSIYTIDTLAGSNNLMDLGAAPSGSILDEFGGVPSTATYGYIAASALPGPTGLFTGIYPNKAWTDTNTNMLVFQYSSCSDCNPGGPEEFGGFSGPLGGLAFAASGTLYVIDNGGSMIDAVSPSNCTVTATPTCSGIVQYPVPSGGAFKIVQGPDGNMWFTENGLGKIGILVPSTGKVTEIPVPSGSGAGPRGITVGPDGNIWFTEYNNGKIGEVVL